MKPKSEVLFGCLSSSRLTFGCQESRKLKQLSSYFLEKKQNDLLTLFRGLYIFVYCPASLLCLFSDLLFIKSDPNICKLEKKKLVQSSIYTLYQL